MRNFQNTFEIRKRSFISAFSICMNVPLSDFGQNHEKAKVVIFGNEAH